jgi:hypothetical protein
VNLQVFNGASLGDPHGLLDGTGKELRHVKCRATADADRPGLGELLSQAVARAGLEGSGSPRGA